MKIIIPSGSPENLVACAVAIRRSEPTLDPKDIIVIADPVAWGQDDDEPHEMTWILGKRPFVFAEAVNKGINAAGGDDVIVLGDDGILETPLGFTKMLAAARKHNYGMLSASIRGLVGNRRQALTPGDTREIVDEPEFLCFVCVAILRSTIDKAGLMDERLTGYGFDDNAYCLLAKRAGVKMGTYTGCIVEHGSRPSVYRSRPDFQKIFRNNAVLFGHLKDYQ